MNTMKWGSIVNSISVAPLRAKGIKTSVSVSAQR